MVELAEAIHLFPEAVNPEICKEIIRRFEADDRKYVGTLGGAYTNRTDESVRKATDLFISPLPEWQDIHMYLTNVMVKSFQKFSERYPMLNEYTMECWGFYVQRTKPGEYFNWHADVGSFRTCARQVIGFFYLNDIEEGGETEFLNQKIKVQPRAGQMTMFPPFWTHVHRGVPPVRETKYTIISGLRFTPPKVA